jgi:hypothetical protein
LKDRTAARRFRTTLEGLEQAGQGPDLRRGDITLDAWAGQVLATLHAYCGPAGLAQERLGRSGIPTSAR